MPACTCGRSLADAVLQGVKRLARLSAQHLQSDRSHPPGTVQIKLSSWLDEVNADHCHHAVAMAVLLCPCVILMCQSNGTAGAAGHANADASALLTQLCSLQDIITIEMQVRWLLCMRATVCRIDRLWLPSTAQACSSMPCSFKCNQQSSLFLIA